MAASFSRALLFRLASSDRFERVVRSLPQTERLAYVAARRYVAGSTWEEAFTVVHELHARGLAASIDLFGEQVRDTAEAEATTNEYIAVAERFSLPASVRLQIGAEDSRRSDRIFQVVFALARDRAPLMATLQANLRRSDVDVLALVGAGIPIRLVKGA